MKTSDVIIKICGLSKASDIATALDCGADMVGFVFFPASPRNVTPQQAGALCSDWSSPAKKVALVVNADDALLESVVSAMAPDILQLHGGETPERTHEIRQKFSLPVMKALGVSTLADLDCAPAYAKIADWLLFDAKPPKQAARPGGNGISFDWTLLSALKLDRPWLLSGGLDAGNVAAALRATAAPGVDVSSGVERAPGVKDGALIRAFIDAARLSSH